MSIYDQDFEQIGAQLTPPDKRLPKFTAWIFSLMNPMQWNTDLFFIDYRLGSSAILYSGATAYALGDRVKYNNKIYECILATTGNLPTDETCWILVLNDFRGATERVNYNGQKLSLEWILNKWFDTAFVQPVFSPLSANSDFYINELTTDDDSFLISLDSSTGPSYIGLDNFSEDFIGLSYVAVVNNFTVNYPLSVIPSTSNSKYKEMVSLVNQYKLYGTLVTYTGY
jgi:hypothetical protein